MADLEGLSQLVTPDGEFVVDHTQHCHNCLRIGLSDKAPEDFRVEWKRLKCKVCLNAFCETCADYHAAVECQQFAPDPAAGGAGETPATREEAPDDAE